MRPDEFKPFCALIKDVHSFYRQDVSEFSLDVWWQSMKGYDYAAVKDALGRHAMNPDSGQFLPKPADVVKMLQGSTQDSALGAWARVDRAIRTVGPWMSVCFDDALINGVIAEMGGWVELSKVTDKDLPFRAKEFENRYRGYRTRSQLPEYPAYLPGIAEQQNAHEGKRVDPPVLIGNPQLAEQVFRKGSNAPRITVTPMAALLLNQEVANAQSV